MNPLLFWMLIGLIIAGLAFFMMRLTQTAYGIFASCSKYKNFTGRLFWNSLYSAVFFCALVLAIAYQYYQPSKDILRFAAKASPLVQEIPAGYFSVYQKIESSSLRLAMKGAPVYGKLRIDISAGKAWSEYWNSENLKLYFGESIKCRLKIDGKEIDINAYPKKADPVFQIWLDEVYLKSEYPKYINQHLKEGLINQREAQAALEWGRK